MKNVKFLIIASMATLLFVEQTKAQVTIERQVTASAGGSYSGTFQADWSMGEMVVSSAQAGSVIINQGFHQMLYQQSSSGTTKMNTGAIQAWPNPSLGLFHLSSANVMDASVLVYNSTGALAAKYQWKGTDGFDVNLESNASGVYLVCIKSGDHIQTLRLSKI